MYNILGGSTLLVENRFVSLGLGDTVNYQKHE
jgi:hypothetical protein